MAFSLFLICLPVIVPIIFVVVLFLLFRYLRARDEWRREGSERARRKAFVLMMTMIVISATTTAVYVASDLQRYRIDYSAVVDGGAQSGVVYIPVSMNEDVQEELRVVDGDGRISIVETMYGRALRVEFTGDVKVEGRVSGSDYFDDWRLSMYPNGTEGRMVWAGLVLDGGGNATVGLDLNIDSRIATGCDSGYSVRGPLASGWNTYRLDGYIV